MTYDASEYAYYASYCSAYIGNGYDFLDCMSIMTATYELYLDDYDSFTLPTEYASIEALGLLIEEYISKHTLEPFFETYQYHGGALPTQVVDFYEEFGTELLAFLTANPAFTQLALALASAGTGTVVATTAASTTKQTAETAATATTVATTVSAKTTAKETDATASTEAATVKGDSATTADSTPASRTTVDSRSTAGTDRSTAVRSTAAQTSSAGSGASGSARPWKNSAVLATLFCISVALGSL